MVPVLVHERHPACTPVRVILDPPRDFMLGAWEIAFVLNVRHALPGIEDRADWQERPAVEQPNPSHVRVTQAVVNPQRLDEVSRELYCQRAFQTADLRVGGRFT